MRLIQKRLLPEYRRIAKQFGITPELVGEIEAFQWKFVKDNISKGRDDVDTFENIYLRYLGTFHVSEAVLNHIKRAKEKRDDKENKQKRGEE